MQPRPPQQPAGLSQVGLGQGLEVGPAIPQLGHGHHVREPRAGDLVGGREEAPGTEGVEVVPLWVEVLDQEPIPVCACRPGATALVDQWSAPKRRQAPKPSAAAAPGPPTTQTDPARKARVPARAS